VAKAEREKYENRIKAMDDWLMGKKLEEAERVAHMRELDRREELEKQMRDERNTNSYRDWMKIQSAKKKQSKSYNKRKKQVDEDVMARNRAQRDMERDMMQNDGYDGGMEEEERQLAMEAREREIQD